MTVLAYLTDNELAKDHIRYMVGGRSPVVSSERLLRFWFPERPGALARFLATMGADWNISLFHYRMHGGDFGRVLIGLELPDGQERELKAFLDGLGYRYVEPMVHWGRELLSEAGYFHSVSMLDDPLRIKRACAKAGIAAIRASVSARTSR